MIYCYQMIKLMLKRGLNFLIVFALAIGVVLPCTQASAVSGGTTIDLTDTTTTSGTGWTFTPTTNTYNITGDVTVVGTILQVLSTLTLNIANGATVDWSAKYQSDSSYNGTVVSLPGNGTLDINQLGYIRNAGSGVAIRSTGANSTINISGFVESQSGGAIRADGINAKVFVNGGMVVANGTSTVQPTIYMYNQSNNTTNVVVSSTGLVAANTYGAPAIQNYGNVVVTDNATVSQIGGSGGGQGPTINALGPTSNVTVSGGRVYSEQGTAIHTNTPGASINITNGQVYSISGNRAIYAQDANSTVTVSGGFVFANGTNTSASSSGAAAVINSSHLSTSPDGVVVAWNSIGTTTYMAGATTDLTTAPAVAMAEWHNNENIGGISYANNSTVGFFPVHSVVVTPATDGLFFDVVTGIFYTDATLTTPYTGQTGLWSWDSGPNTLTLNDFNWTTTSPNALTVVGGNITINLMGSNSFASTYEFGQSKGIYSDSMITIAGAGSLTATGSSTNLGFLSYGIDANFLVIGSGTVTAIGKGYAVYNTNGSSRTVVLSTVAYTYWTNQDTATDPGGNGTSFVNFVGTAYEWDYNDRFVRIQSLTPLSFTATQTGGRAGSADSTGIVLSFNQTVDGLTASDITVTDGTGQVITGDLVGTGTTWTLTLDKVLTAGDVIVSIGNFDTFIIATTPQAVAVYKLLVNPSKESSDTPNVPNSGFLGINDDALSSSIIPVAIGVLIFSGLVISIGLLLARRRY